MKTKHFALILAAVVMMIAGTLHARADNTRYHNQIENYIISVCHDSFDITRESDCKNNLRRGLYELWAACIATAGARTRSYSSYEKECLYRNIPKTQQESHQ